MAAPKSSKRPKARPMPEDMPSNRALTSATRPKARPEKMAEGGQIDMLKRHGAKMAAEGKNLFGGRKVDPETMGRKNGGMVCRGGGKATKGKGYSKAG